MTKHGVWVALGLVFSVGCGDDGGTVDPDAPTYYADIAPLVQRECLSCHVEGGIAPFALDSYEAVEENASSVVSAVTSGYMPPWLPSQDCGEFAHERSLTPEERQVFVAWNAGGLQAGDPADAPPPPEDEIIEFTPTHTASIGEGGYVADVTRPDDYRCFVLDVPVDETRYLTGSWVEPGQDEIVHHVLVYAVPPEQAADVDAANGADGTLGYTCFGGPLPESGESGGLGGGIPPTQLGAWVPGQTPSLLPAGRGIRIEAGSRVVMQVHYNTLETSPGPDETEFQMVLTTDQPEVLIETDPLPILDIPAWDFQWQQAYGRPQGSPVVVQPGEGIEVSCTYDNSAVNQPVVNGMQVDPVDVDWGEGTLDEMCILYISREVPFTERVPPLETCGGLDDCRAECGDSLSCIYACDVMNGRDRECQNCATGQIVECVRETTTCGLEWLQVGDCLRDCVVNVNILGGNFDACLSSQCASQYEAMVSCTDDLLASGACDSYVSTCDASLGSGS